MSQVYKASRKSEGKDGQTFWNPVGFTVFVGEWEGRPSVTLVDERTGERYPCFPPKSRQDAAQGSSSSNQNATNDVPF